MQLPHDRRGRTFGRKMDKVRIDYQSRIDCRLSIAGSRSGVTSGGLFAARLPVACDDHVKARDLG